MNNHSTDLSSREEYDLWTAEQFEKIKDRVEPYFLDLEIPCPYGMPHQAVFRQALFAPIDHHVMELFLNRGYRRNGDCLYNMACPDCKSCLSIRLLPKVFVPNRSQKRNWKKNSDIDVRVRPLKEIDEEHIALCERFLSTRYPKDNDARRYYYDFFANTITSTYEINYYLKDRLLGTSIVDMGANYINAVYYFFDPEEKARGLGIYNILYLIDFCRRRDIELLHLGYYIKECKAMRYKSQFRPHQLLQDGRWQNGEE